MITILNKNDCYKIKDWQLRAADQEQVNQVLKDTARKRKLNQMGQGGKTKDKTGDGSMWAQCNIPYSVYFSKWYMEMFPSWMPQEDFTKESRKWLEANPEYKLI